MRRIIFAALASLLLLGVEPARAIDFSVVLVDLDGKPVKDGDVEVTLARAVVQALLNVFPDEPNLAGAEKMRRFLLAQKVHQAKGDFALTDQERDLIKKLVEKAYGPLVLGRVWAAIDPASAMAK